MKHLDLFSGIGGFALAARWVGWETVGFCEIDPYCQKVLAKHWPGVPIYEDVRELSGEKFGPVDIITGGFPCQDISYAGKGAGIEGERSGLWTELARIIGEVRPRYAVLENVSALLGRGLDRVAGDLAEIGYDCEWHCIPASYIGAWHRRDRIWILAHPQSNSARLTDRPILRQRHLSLQSGRRFKEWPGRSDLPASRFCRGDDGIPARMERNRGLGNAILPQVAEMIFRAINEV